MPRFEVDKEDEGGKPARGHVADSADHEENHQHAKVATLSTLNKPSYQGDQEALV